MNLENSVLIYSIKIMNLKIHFLLLALTALTFTNISFAGDSESDVKSRYSYDKKEGKPKVFIEGTWLDFDFMRRNMKFVDFVNDPLVADVHIIIKRRVNGGGGSVYSVMFNNRTYENMGDYTLSCTSPGSDTHEERRKVIANTLKLGLMPYANESEISKKLSVRYHEKGGEPGVSKQKDPWKSWTFRGDLSGNMDLEENRESFNYRYNLRADKVTEDWRYRNSAFKSVRKREYVSDGETYTSENIRNYYSSSVVNSLSNRWSAGAFVDYSNSNYSNILYSFSLKPAIEYNIFPWDISDRKVFTIAYYNGPEWKNYYEETIYDKLKETLWEHTIQMDLKIVNTWGELGSRIVASNYLHDFSKNRITLSTDLSVRIVRGLSVRFDVRAENIHDQLYLPKSEATLEDVLLNNVKLPSTFELSAGIGIRLQFGSIYNNIVNNRL